MVIVRTQDGQQLVFDLRNNLAYLHAPRGGWDEVHLTTPLHSLEAGMPILARDQFGLLDGLVIRSLAPYTGPHPGGAKTCSCGVKRDEDGDCPRCDYGRCQECKTALLKIKHPADREKSIFVCPKDPMHNPILVPQGRTTRATKD